MEDQTVNSSAGSAQDGGRSIRHGYLLAARSAATLVSNPAVGANWAKPSSLAEFSVSGLAGHLASQLFNVLALLDVPVPAEPAIPLLDHYGAASWRNVDINDPVNVRIRETGERIASEGPVALAAQVNEALAQLDVALRDQESNRLVHIPWVGWSLTLDDFLVTRMMEIAVHSDDLAVSVVVETPVLPEAVNKRVLALLLSLSEIRHGPTAVLRALSRAERAPASIAAI